MIIFLLGVSITINVIFIAILLFYLKFKIKKDFFNSEFIFDKNMAKDFLK